MCSDATRGGLETYVYHPGRVNVCGDDWFWGNGAQATGAWQHVRMWLQLNDIGRPRPVVSGSTWPLATTAGTTCAPVRAAVAYNAAAYNEGI